MVTARLCLFVILLAYVAYSGTARRIYDDLEAAGSDKKEEWKKGDESDYHESDHSEKGEKGEKGYKGEHRWISLAVIEMRNTKSLYTFWNWNCSSKKGENGHHDKEGHEGEYEEEKGHKKKFHDDDGYHSKKENGKKGEKGHKFHEEGSFKKGHSTKGHHVIHKLDESKKNKKFFDEDHDSAYEEKHGDFHEEEGSKKGGSHKKGHKKAYHEEGEKGKKGHGKKGHHHNDESGTNLLLSFLLTSLGHILITIAIVYIHLTGHKGEKEHEEHYGHKSDKGKKGGKDHHKKWGHKKSHSSH